ncbi:phosphatidate cytidylyltransferase [Achlya hypogyna]|uniref:Phosphatidate cytidylyltransferase n=1 Tax=Achlya hypogyna TaxID=1202772 RepID=A0A1V9YDS5_ACHHY|nr:phosphatidate cytidylyltransferase [Achlya hypogyna]
MRRETPLQNFAKRLVSGTVLAVGVLFLFYSSPSIATISISSLLVAACLYEYAWLSFSIKDSIAKGSMITRDAIDRDSCAISGLHGRWCSSQRLTTALLVTTTTVVAVVAAIAGYHFVDLGIKSCQFYKRLLPFIAVTTGGSTLAAAYTPTRISAMVLVLSQLSFALIVCNSILCPVDESRCVFIIDSSFMLLSCSCAIYILHLCTAATVQTAVIAIVLDQLAIVYIVGMVQIIVNFVVFSVFSDSRKLIVVLLLSVWAADSGSYFCGHAMRLAKYTRGWRLAPRLSPNKDVEGTAAGVIVALGTMFAAVKWTGLERSLYEKLLMTVLGIVFGRLGDLFESMIKRAAGVKDSSAMIPGHGGVMDRVDALLFASVVFCVFNLDNRLLH